MTRNFFLACTLVAALPLAAADSVSWTNVAPGVDYQEFKDAHTDIHVARIDLTMSTLQVISTPAPYRGTIVSDFAQKTKALVAINGDYFDEHFVPRGVMINPCDNWAGAQDNKMNEYTVAISDKSATIQPMSTFVLTSATATAAVSGWPLLIKSCTPLTAKDLPGSDVFTRAPQPRTAVGVSDDGKTMYFVVADGRRTGVPGLTLAELALFMADELDVCSAVNLDGGGSSAMWVANKIVNQPADGVERKVGDHLAVVLKSDMICPTPATQQTASTSTTQTTTVTTVTTTTAVPTPTTPTPTTTTSAAPMTSATTTTATTTTPPPATSTAPPRR